MKIPKSTLALMNTLIVVGILSLGGVGYRHVFPASGTSLPAEPTASTLSEDFDSLGLNGQQRAYYAALFSSVAGIIEADSKTLTSLKHIATLTKNVGQLSGLKRKPQEGLGKIMADYLASEVGSKQGDLTKRQREKAAAAWRTMSEEIE